MLLLMVEASETGGGEGWRAGSRRGRDVGVNEKRITIVSNLTQIANEQRRQHELRFH